MTSAQAMDIIYPLCTSLFGGYLLLKIVFLIYVKRTWVVMFDALILLTETIVLGLLAILTGESPRMDIEQYRYLVTLTRGVMCVAIFLGMCATVRAIWLQVEKRHRHERNINR
jgi:hypothetical protein